jgi:hypothetical protein
MELTSKCVFKFDSYACHSFSLHKYNHLFWIGGYSYSTLDIIFFSIDEKTLSVSVSFEVNFRSVEAQIILTNHNDCCYVSGLKLNI